MCGDSKLSKRTIRDIEVDGKNVLVRVDFNIPLDIRTGAISDDTRLRAVLPTVRYLIDHKARVILCSHLGRPDGKVVDSLRMAPVALRFSQLIGRPVITTTDCVGSEAREAVSALENGEILLLENLRFHPEEVRNDPSFARSLAQLANIYVDDAFGTAHRAHASTVGVAEYLPSVAGFLMEKELRALGSIMDNPATPFCALLGGAKVSDKIALIQNILDKVNLICVGGGMAATFLHAQGYGVGYSSVEGDKLDLARQLVESTKRKGVSFHLPVDVMVADSIDDNAQTDIVSVAEIEHTKYIVDIGPQTIKDFCQQLKQCQTVFWNGPLGICEIPRFARGTKSIADFVAGIEATTVIGGGSTAETVAEMGLSDKMTHVSTGGGAGLMFLEGKTLPGVAVLLEEA